MLKGYITRRPKTLYYVIYKFYEIFRRSLDSRKKLQKLMFLIEHYDLERGIIGKSERLTGYTFKIWFYGPFSFEIYDDLNVLVRNKVIRETVINYDEEPILDETLLGSYIDDGEPRKIFYYEPIEKLEDIVKYVERNPYLRFKVERILEMFGRLKPYEIEDLVINKLRLTPFRKLEYWGLTIDEYLEKTAANRS